MTLEELKRVNLMTLLSRAWGTAFSRSGNSFVALSPFSAEKNGSFYVSAGEDGHWVYCDHSDGSSGSIIDLMMRQNNCNDFASAHRAAQELVSAHGLCAEEPLVAVKAEKSTDWEWLYHALCKQDSRPCLDYLVGRGLDVQLVQRLIDGGMIVSNIQDGSQYCCFVVRDVSGQIRGLSNRLIDGPSERAKFQLGRHWPFCVDWSVLASAEAVYVCESIIDALSLLTLDPATCVVAFTGANADVSGLALAPGARLIDAFDADAAGRAAAVRLQRAYADHTVERFDLHGFGDVNEYLQNPPASTTRKLSAEQRLAICLDERASREVAAAYGVHHSYVCSIRQEATTLLRAHWQSKRVGRKATITEPVDVPLTNDLAEQTRRADLLEMQNDWLKLQLDIHEQRDAEVEKKVRSKKRKKKRLGNAVSA